MNILKDLVLVIMFCVCIYYEINYLMLKQRQEKMMKHFTDALIHDLRTPILAQLRAIELLQKGTMGKLNAGQTEFAAQIEESCKYALSMISMLLKTYRMEIDNKEIKKEIFSFTEVLMECFEEVLPVAKEKQVEFVFPESKYDTLIEADKADIKTVISSLLRNAIMYSDKNEKIFVTLCKNTCRLTMEIKNKSVLYTSKSSQAMLYNVLKYAPIGENIGLYLSQKIVKNYNGTISTFCDGQNVGRFVFTLPSY